MQGICQLIIQITCSTTLNAFPDVLGNSRGGAREPLIDLIFTEA